MASLEKRPHGFRAVFMHGGRKIGCSLRTKDERQARAALARLEDNLRLVERGVLTVPEGADLAEFLLTDGKSAAQPKPEPLTLKALFDAYFERLPDGGLEASTLKLLQLHVRHLTKHFGGGTAATALTADRLQGYVAKRSQAKGHRGRRLGSATIKKELATLRAVCNWGVQMVLATVRVGGIPRSGAGSPTACLARGVSCSRRGLSAPRRVAPADFKAGWETIFLAIRLPLRNIQGVGVRGQ